MNMNIDSILEKMVKHYKTGMIISFILLFSVIGGLFYNYYQTGSFVKKGIDFSGGTQYIIEVENDIDNIDGIKSSLESLTNEEVQIKKTSNNYLIINTKQNIEKEDLTNILTENNISIKGISSQKIGEALGSEFWKQGIRAIIIAYIIIALVVFVMFRSFVPSLAALLASVSDIITAVFLMNVFKIPLTLSSLAGLLILIGYSIDTDILLSTRVLKNKEGPLDKRIVSSIKTGMTMSLTSIGAVTVMYFISGVPGLQQIALVMIFGLTADIPYTWLQNVGILKSYMVNRK